MNRPMKVNKDQERKFKIALCRELGIDPDRVLEISVDWTAAAPMAQVTWTGHDYMPADHVVGLFNAAAKSAAD